MKNKYPELKGVRKTVFSVREARARFSEVIRLAALGTDITISVHGKPSVKLVQARSESKPFKVNWELLRNNTKKCDKKNLSENLIRADRDGRGW